jgi:hypothetical protein
MMHPRFEGRYRTSSRHRLSRNGKLFHLVILDPANNCQILDLHFPLRFTLALKRLRSSSLSKMLHAGNSYRLSSLANSEALKGTTT